MLSKLLLTSVCLNIAFATPFPPGPNHGHPYGPGQRALYIQDNDPAGNNVIAAAISTRDGTLSNAVKTSTGGKGLDKLVAASQDSVVVAGDYLFVTNAGDDTLSVFSIDSGNPTSLKLLGKPASTNGHTPVSVTYSEALNVACAVNSGNKAGVQCYNVDHEKGLFALPFFLNIPQTELADPTPPPAGPLVITADIRFNPSSSALFATVRSNGALPGILYAWPIHSGEFTQTPINNILEGIVFPFSLNFLSSDSKLFLTNPHFDSAGAAILDLTSSGQVTKVQNITIPGQVASCWVSYDPGLQRTFLIDAARPVITIVDSDSGKVSSQYNFTTPIGGGQDNKVDRNFLYVLTDPFNGNFEVAAPPRVLMYDVADVQAGRTPREVQSFDVLKVVGKMPGAIGLAVYPAARFT